MPCCFQFQHHQACRCRASDPVNVHSCSSSSPPFHGQVQHCRANTSGRSYACAYYHHHHCSCACNFAWRHHHHHHCWAVKHCHCIHYLNHHQQHHLHNSCFMSSTQPSQWPLPGSYIQNVAPEPKSSETTEIWNRSEALQENREDADANEFEEEEPVFVLTDEWAEFFAKSEARRREKKKQLKKEAKKMQKAERLAQKQNSNEYKIPLFEEGKASETESVCLSNKSND